MANIKYSRFCQNYTPIREGQNEKEAIEAMVDLAQTTEKMGYQSYWIAEHHNNFDSCQLCYIHFN